MKLPIPQTTCAGLLALACLLASGCTRDKGGATAEAGRSSQAPPAQGASQDWQNGERAWVGLLPCSDCQGIDTRLVLRSREGRRDYLLTETYIGGGGRNTFSREGVWTQVSETGDGEPRTLYVLDPEQAGQRFSLQPDGALELLEGNGERSGQAVAYRLQRL
jgi:copper homeostasis protein (lipoprotein)